MTDTDYKTLEREAALRFLQTAIVVDDGATTNPRAEKIEKLADEHESTHSKPGTTEITGPGLDALLRAAGDSEPGPGPEKQSRPPVVPVNVKVISAKLADLGITCGILRPDPDEADDQIEDRVVNSSARADLVVMDWVLDADSELTSLNAIKRIVEKDESGSRVIAVYTSETALDEIRAEILETVPNAKRIGGKDRMVQADGTRIALFLKSGPTGKATVRGRSAYTEEQLAARIIEIFIEAVKGWVRAIALHGMAAIRENVHSVLTRLDPSLDAGYAANQLRIDHLEEAPKQILDAIGSEFRDVIQDDRGARGAAGADGFRLWARHRDGLGDMFCPVSKIEQAIDAPDGDRRDAILGEIRSEVVAAKLVSKKLFDDQMTAVLFKGFDRAKARESDGRFAMLLSLRYLYGDAERSLRLGTVMEDEDGGYWLCVQPVCDSVRLTKPTRFPLLKLGSRAGKKGSIRLAVQGRSRRALLSNPGTPDEIEVFRFKPDKRSKRILFGKQPNENGEYRLETADGKRKFWWLAELKPSHGNRVTHKVGEKLTRVGLDESMWLHEQSS